MRKIRRHRPAIVALVGVTVWRALLEALGDRDARKRPVTFGFQPELTTPTTRYFVLPNPSGRNANYSYEEMLAAFGQLRAATRGSMSVTSCQLPVQRKLPGQKHPLNVNVH